MQTYLWRNHFHVSNFLIRNDPKKTRTEQNFDWYTTKSSNSRRLLCIRKLLDTVLEKTVQKLLDGVTEWYHKCLARKKSSQHNQLSIQSLSNSLYIYWRYSINSEKNEWNEWQLVAKRNKIVFENIKDQTSIYM